jgi:hypothetical protein
MTRQPDGTGRDALREEQIRAATVGEPARLDGPITLVEYDPERPRVFKGPDTDVNLHVFSDACAEVQRMRLFRDTLRSDDGERLRYQRAKRELAARTWDYVQNYADAKSEVVEAITARAEAQKTKRR